MAQGKIVVLDTPKEIKRSYGVGYTLVVEKNEQPVEEGKENEISQI
jgi:hypothetical protein